MKVNPFDNQPFGPAAGLGGARLEAASEIVSDPRSGDVRGEAATSPAARPPRPGRAHVRQALHRLEKVVRNAVREELRSADELDPRLRREIRRLEHEFAHDLGEAFHEAGRGRAFDPSRLLSGVSEAIVGMTEGLRLILAEPPPPGEGEIGTFEIVDREAPPPAQTEETPDEPIPTPAPDRGLLVDLEA